MENYTIYCVTSHIYAGGFAFVLFLVSHIPWLRLLNCYCFLGLIVLRPLFT